VGEQSIGEAIRLAILKALDGARIGVGTGERRDVLSPEQVAATVLHELTPSLLHCKETVKERDELAAKCLAIDQAAHVIEYTNQRITAELTQARAGADALAQSLVTAHAEAAQLSRAKDVLAACVDAKEGELASAIADRDRLAKEAADIKAKTKRFAHAYQEFNQTCPNCDGGDESASCFCASHINEYNAALTELIMAGGGKSE